jgi:hypothetical protein
MQATTLIDEVKTSTDLLGEENVIKILQNARTDKFKNEHTGYVVGIVINTIGIDINELKKNNCRTDKRKVAIGFCVYFLNNIFGYSYRKISINMPINLDTRGVFRNAKIIKDAKLIKPVSDIDKLISQHLNTLSEIFSTYKKKIDGKNN